MTTQDELTIERALGIIQGIAYSIDGPVANGLIAAVEMITGIVDKEREEDAK